MPEVYYNENDKQAVKWLKQLITGEHLPKGDVDDRSIRDVLPSEVTEYKQCHFFAGVGGWALALGQAGWGDRPVWTGSCPCQPFSTAGKKKGVADERHLWPDWFWLVKQCRPDALFGEQVANKPGESWFDIVSTDLEGEGYTCGTAVFPACSVGAPHLRKRLYWVADSGSEPSKRHTRSISGKETQISGQGKQNGNLPERHKHGGASDNMANATSERRRETGDAVNRSKEWKSRDRAISELANATSERRDGGKGTSGEAGGNGGKDRGSVGKLVDANDTGPQRHSWNGDGSGQPGRVEKKTGGPHNNRGSPEQTAGPTNGFWRDADWLYCRDAKWRAVEPGTFPLADGVPARVAQLRGYGNAIVIPQAVEFIKAYLNN